MDILTFKKRIQEKKETLPQKEMYGISISPDSFTPAEWTGEITYTHEGSNPETLEEFLSRDAHGLDSFFTHEGDFLSRHIFLDSFVNAKKVCVYDIRTTEEFPLVLETKIEGNASDIIIVIARKNNRAHFLSTIFGNGFLGRTVYLLAEEGAHIEYGENAEGPRFARNLFGDAKEGSHIGIFDGSFGGNVTALHGKIILLGKDSEARISGVFLKTSAESDIRHEVVHKGDYSRSHVFARGMSLPSGKIIYRGNIKMERGVRGAWGREDGKFLLGGAGAEVDAIPELEIGNKESIVSHALGITHIRPEDIFPLSLRGVDEGEARKMFIRGFLSSPFELEKEGSALWKGFLEKHIISLS